MLHCSNFNTNMNKLFCSFIIFLFLFFFSIDNYAQEQRFKAGVLIGVNAAQINGDQTAGFNKLGIVGGLRGVAILKDKMELSVEMLFSQRGSQTELIPDQFVVQRVIHLNYIEVPVLFNYMDWFIEEDVYYKMHFHGGLSYGRLLNASTKEVSINVDNLAQNDFSWVLGATFYPRKKIGLTIRYNRSINKLLTEGGDLIGYFLNFHAVYMF